MYIAHLSICKDGCIVALQCLFQQRLSQITVHFTLSENMGTDTSTYIGINTMFRHTLSEAAYNNVNTQMSRCS